MQPTSDSELQLLGKTIAGKYELKMVHASGAFGTVFLAHQFFSKQFVRPVAVKISRQTGLTEQNAPYLFGDALILAQLLSGPHRQGKQHLVPIFDMGLLPEYQGRGYLVMEHVEGAPLLSHIRTAGKIGVRAGLRYFKEICRALALVHRQGAIHRDLKPDNILIDRAGVVRVVDFGLATFTDPRLGFAPGSMGTFTYMAPETLMGTSTPAADVYSLGLVAYEMFTGSGPHLTVPWPAARDHDTGQEHYRLKTALRFVPPSEVHNEIRHDFRWLDTIIQRCLEIDAGRRFRDAGQLLEAIETCEAGGEIPMLPETASTSPEVASTSEDEDSLIRQARRFLARKQYEKVIDLLDIHRPAEWAVVDLDTMRVLRLLGKAYAEKGDHRNASDCLSQLRSLQKEQAILPRQEYLAGLTDLCRCFEAKGQPELAHACREEMKSRAI